MKCRPLLLSIIVFALFGFSAVHAQDAPEQDIPLADRLDGFDAEIERVMGDWSVPGLAIAVVTDSSVVWSKGFGERNIKAEAPVTDETLFAIGSTTKAFTAAGLGILHDKGQIEWSAPVREYLPQFKIHSEFATKEMTPIDLLTHRSGLPRHDLLWYATDYSRENLLRRLRHLEPSASFRSTFQYQNLMYMTAGYLAGQVSGSSWENFTREHLFEPLGMTRSTFSVETMQEAENYARPYGGGRDSTLLVDYRSLDPIEPAGSINSSVSEMTPWIQLFFNHGNHNGTQIIDSTTVAELTRPRIVLEELRRFMPQNQSLLYAFGWLVEMYDEHRIIWHSGGIDGFSAMVGMLPNKEVGWIILTNKGSTPVPSILMYELVNRIIGKEGPDWNQRITKFYKQEQAQPDSTKADTADTQKETTTPADPSHPLSDYVGEYSNQGYGTFEITMKGDSLMGRYGSISYGIQHDRYDVFKMHFDIGGNELIVKIQFKMDMDGNIDEVVIPMEPAIDPIMFTRTVSEKLKSAAYLQRFTGDYSFKDQTLTVRLRGKNTLTLTVPGQPTYELEPSKENMFDLKRASGYSAEFTMKNDTVIKMTLHQPNGTFTAEKK